MVYLGSVQEKIFPIVHMVSLLMQELPTFLFLKNILSILYRLEYGCKRHNVLSMEKEFDSLLAGNAVPQFNTMRFGNDHTEG
jgi:hypothetical protein